MTKKELINIIKSKESKNIAVVVDDGSIYESYIFICNKRKLVLRNYGSYLSLVDELVKNGYKKSVNYFNHKYLCFTLKG